MIVGLMIYKLKVQMYIVEEMVFQQHIILNILHVTFDGRNIFY